MSFSDLPAGFSKDSVTSSVHRKGKGSGFNTNFPVWYRMCGVRMGGGGGGLGSHGWRGGVLGSLYKKSLEAKILAYNLNSICYIINYELK